jgi:hypothetical protein
MARLLQGFLMTISLYSLLAWGYVVGRILWTGTIPRGVSVLGAYVPFWVLGIIAFVLSFAFMVLYVLASVDHGPRSAERPY